jgi:hypothetical protein
VAAVAAVVVVIKSVLMFYEFVSSAETQSGED